jgi:hypothetical protein
MMGYSASGVAIAKHVGRDPILLERKTRATFASLISDCNK